MKCKRIAAALATVILCSCTNIENRPVETENTDSVEAIITFDSDYDEIDFVTDVEETESEDEIVSDTVSEPITVTEATEPEFPEPDREEFTKRLNKIYSDYGITGMSVALFRNKEIIHTENIGYADAETKALCDDGTHYRLASTSKLISTMVLMTLYDDGKIDLDSCLTDITGIQYDRYNKEKIKLWHLLTHTSGIIDTYIYELAISYKYGIDYILSSAHNGYEPGVIYNYSNFGAGSIGAIVEKLTGEFFHDYADRAFFEPLGMDAGYVIDLIDDKESCVTLYDYDGEVFHVPTWKRNREYYESFGMGNSYMAAQCELIITATDLARLGIVLAGDGTLGGKIVLSQDAVKAMNTPYFSAPNFDMGLNVRIYDDLIEGRTIYGHPGNALGAITGLFYDISDGTGVAFLTNRCSMAVDEKGFYKAIKETLVAAYECYFR